MAKLHAAERNALPTSAFALPEQRRFPIIDLNHAKLARAMASKYATANEKKRIFAAVARKFPTIGK